jgi:WD40 repeat protein
MTNPLTALVPTLTLSLTLLLAAGSPASACTNIYGIPGECDMSTHLVDVPGVGLTPLDAEPSVTELSRVHMSGRWSFRAYSLAPDAQSNWIHYADGFEIHYAGRRRVFKDLEMLSNPRGVTWSPDSRRVAFWAPGVTQGVALLDVRHLDGEAPWEVVYDQNTLGGERNPFGIEWSPHGDAIYVLERFRDDDDDVFGVVVRVDLVTGEAEEVLRQRGMIDFLSAQGGHHRPRLLAPDEPFRLLLGLEAGLATCGPRGEELRFLDGLPALGLHNLEWSPDDPNLVLLFYRRPSTGGDGRVIRGLYRLDLSSGQVTQLSNETDTHTVWYSPNGTWTSWASPRGVSLLRDGDAEPRPLLPLGDDGRPLHVRGLTWHRTERWVAYVAGLQLFVLDLETGDAREVARFEAYGFLAEPQWSGDRLLVTLFVDKGERTPRPRVPNFDFDLDPPAPGDVEPDRDGGRPR